MNIISYSKEYEWRELALFGDGVPCDRCGGDVQPNDKGREVMTDKHDIRIICKRCADEVIHGVR